MVRSERACDRSSRAEERRGMVGGVDGRASSQEGEKTFEELL
jgi:hypothetical protein